MGPGPLALTSSCLWRKGGLQGKFGVQGTGGPGVTLAVWYRAHREQAQRFWHPRSGCLTCCGRPAGQQAGRVGWCTYRRLQYIKAMLTAFPFQASC